MYLLDGGRGNQSIVLEGRKGTLVDFTRSIGLEGGEGALVGRVGRGALRTSVAACSKGRDGSRQCQQNERGGGEGGGGTGRPAQSPVSGREGGGGGGGRGLDRGFFPDCGEWRGWGCLNGWVAAEDQARRHPRPQLAHPLPARTRPRPHRSTRTPIGRLHRCEVRLRWDPLPPQTTTKSRAKPGRPHRDRLCHADPRRPRAVAHVRTLPRVSRKSPPRRRAAAPPGPNRRS